MKHADWLSERILFLDGLPNFQLLGRLRIGETVEEVLKADLALEMEALPLLRDAIEHSEKVRDYVSRDLFRRILDSEEEHVDTLETPVRDDRADGDGELRPAEREGRRGLLTAQARPNVPAACHGARPPRRSTSGLALALQHLQRRSNTGAA